MVYCVVDGNKRTAATKKKRPPSLKGHIWIEGDEGTFLGYGRIALLERIREQGSITQAAKLLDMSYRRAWVLINSMNRQVPRPYVVCSAGGSRGGGTRVTEDGEKAIALFWKVHENFQKFLSKNTGSIRSLWSSMETINSGGKKRL